jgi:hypothetical protein
VLDGVGVRVGLKSRDGDVVADGEKVVRKTVGKGVGGTAVTKVRDSNNSNVRGVIVGNTNVLQHISVRR